MVIPNRAQTEARLIVSQANPQQKCDAFLNVHDEWPHHEDPAEHLKLRLASVQHRRADWFIGLFEDKVVTSLGVYPLILTLAGQPMNAIGIGAVHTQSAYRGRGFAATLLRDVLSRARAKGCRFALLYSDIGTAYYEKFGFTKLESLEFDISLAHLAMEVGPSPELSFSPVVPQEVMPTLMRLYATQFTAHTLGVQRDHDHFSWLLHRENELKGALISHEATSLGYILYKWDKNQLLIRDYAFSHELVRHNSLLTIFHAWLMTMPELAAATVLRGWYHNNLYSYDHVALNAREREVTMVASLDNNPESQTTAPLTLEHHLFSWLDHF